jgi:hypothetical protein
LYGLLGARGVDGAGAEASWELQPNFIFARRGEVMSLDDDSDIRDELKESVIANPYNLDHSELIAPHRSSNSRRTFRMSRS